MNLAAPVIPISFQGGSRIVACVETVAIGAVVTDSDVRRILWSAQTVDAGSQMTDLRRGSPNF